MTILIVDDVPLNRRLLRAQLESDGMDVVEAADGVGALEQLSITKCDAIISDILMPNMDGYRLLHEVRSDPRYAEIPFIVYTNTFTSPSDENVAYQLGADRFLRKPSQVRDLSAALDELFSRPVSRVNRPSDPAHEVALMKEYSEQLISKLEEKNLELEARTRELEATRDQVRLQATALEFAANATIITDRDGVILWTNPAFTTLSGFTAEEAAGQTPRILKSGEHPPSFYRHLWRTIRSGKTWQGDFVNRRKDGKVYYGAATITPVRSAAGEITHFIGIMSDITRQKLAEDRMKDALSFTRTILKESPMGILTYTANGGCVSANEAAARMVGSTVEQLTAQNFRELNSWKESGLLDAAERTLVTGAPSEVELHFVTSFEKEVWLNFRLAAFQYGNELHLLVMFSDVSQRIHASQELERRERRFRSLIENALDVTTVITLQGVISFQSPSVERALGYRPDEMIGRSALDFIHPDDLGSVKEALLSAAAKPSISISLLEFRMRQRDGSWRIMESIGRAVFETGSDGQIIVNSRDVTERRKLENQLKQAQKMEAVGQLAGGVAHDFNNILTVINGYSDILLRTPGFASEIVEKVRQIYSAGERAAKLTRQLLTFSRKQTVHAQLLDLNAIIPETAKMLQRLLGEQVQLDLCLHPDLPAVLADPGMMDQIVVNLAINARDAMPAGGTIVIATEAVTLTEADAATCPGARPGNFVCLSVKDHGTGIAPENLSRIFEPFFTTKEAGKGTGLGLATVLGILSTHNGWPAVETAWGVGTTFKIFLPAESRPARTLAGTAPREKLIGGNETILVVEDEPTVRGFVVIVLEKIGYCVLEAGDGDEAVEVWEQYGSRIDLLLTDMVMPGTLTGRSLAEKLKASKPSLKVIYSSGYDADVAGQLFEGSENTAFLQKPYYPRKLAETIRACLDFHEP